MLFAGILLSSGCRARSGEPQAAPVSVPRLVLAPERLDLGRLVQDRDFQGTAVVRNEGTADLHVGSVTQSRFCSGRVEPATILPGQSANLVVTCRSDLYGPLREGLDVHSNDPRLPKATLRIGGEVTPLLAFDVQAVGLKMPFGEERSQEVRLVGTRVHEARVRLTGAAAPDSEIVALPGQSGSPTGYRVRCLGRKVGSHAGNVVVATGLDRPKEIAIPYSCTVTGTLEVTPSNPFFNLKVPGDKAVRITVKSTQPGFEVQSVRVVEGPFAARVEHAEDDNTYRVDVAVLGDRIEDEARAVVGTLLVESNDRTEPRKEVPLFGSGRIRR